MHISQPTTTQRIHQGPLFLDQNKRYCIYEPDRPLAQLITLTSGLVIELWLEESNKWVVGRVEGDGQDYCFFPRTGSRLKLAERMLVRYLEPCWYLPDSDQPLSLPAGE